MRTDHQLFGQYPLNETATISTGLVPTPYHIYDGYGVFIGGTADLAATRQLLRQESVIPMETQDGRAPMGIWICNFTEASLGPHHELQFSFFVSDQPRGPIASHPLSLLSHMTSPDARMLCHGLWNSTPTAVAYNRELLSLDARLAGSRIKYEAGTLAFNIQDESSKRPVLKGTLPHLDRVSWRAHWDVMRQVGFRRVWELARQPWIGLRILNPVGVVLSRNSEAESFTKNDLNLVRYFNASEDTLEFGDSPYRDLSFKPQFVQYMKGFKFVYMHPKAAGQNVQREEVYAVGHH